MRQLHIRAQSGPRPVTVAAVRALLADGGIDPTSPVLSLDAGRSWQTVEAALAVVDGLAVDDTAVDRALRVGPLHPIAMPLGAVGLILLTAGISFGGGPAGPAIRAAPAAATGFVATTACTAITSVATSLATGGRCVVALATPCQHAGPGLATAASAATTAPAATAAAPVADPSLLTDWRSLLANHDQAAAAWGAAAETLATRTKANGLVAWEARLAMLETLTDDNRARFTASFPEASKAVRLAMFDVTAGSKDIEPISVFLLVEDQALAATCDGIAAARRDLHLSARIIQVASDPAKHAVVIHGTLTAIE